MSIADMASKGERKLSQKQGTMKSNYDAMKGAMVDAYRSVGFGPSVTAKYSNAISNAQYNAPNPTTWRENWVRAMSR